MTTSNNNIETVTYNVVKSYEGYPSKTKTEQKEVSLYDAQLNLQGTAGNWRRNGGTVIEENEMSLTCEESDGSNTITWTIVENESWS